MHRYRLSLDYLILWRATIHGTDVSRIAPTQPNAEYPHRMVVQPSGVDYPDPPTAYGLTSDQAIRRALAKTARRFPPPTRTVSINGTPTRPHKITMRPVEGRTFP